ncbi:MAG: sigma-54-dependent Fis family transcriptional regulator, partial [Planctomycetes bacterium]|nr:sigma-54-dependent Fis family transcriptional regulator [Planctomycetota bacterium]
PRRDKPFIRVNCAALSAGVLESELFGHEKGAFTGADKLRIGRFEMADGGTILLDEVSEMDLGLQGKLLRVLQEKEFERVGSSETIHADVRILASSNRCLEKSIEKGEFRQDLYYRLNVVSVDMPPLRERKEDIPALVKHFIDKYNREEGSRVRSVSGDALKLLEGYDWPGNVRELENIIERAIVLGTSEEIDAGLVAPALRHGGGAPASSASSGAFEPRPLDEVEREHIIKTLEHLEGHRTNTAQVLGISERSLRDRIKRWKEAGLWEE